MQSGLLCAIQSFESQFNCKSIADLSTNIKSKKKKVEEPRQQLLDRLTSKQTEPGMAFIVKKSGNGGACNSLARNKSSEN